MSVARRQHTATLLWDGNVLIAGGRDSSGALATAEVFDPATGSFATTGSLNVARYGHTAVLLSNGKVLVAGGRDASGALASAELYDPAVGTWSVTGGLVAPRADHTATLLPNGTVLVTGGDAGGALGTAEVYDPAVGQQTWSATGSLTTPRSRHTATLLQNGKVLVVGGSNADTPVATAEIYDASTGWSSGGTLTTARDRHTATLLPDGKVFVAGGYGTTPLASAEIYNPSSGWSSAATMPRARDSAAAVLLSTGKVLIVGGNGPFISNCVVPIAGNTTVTESLSTTDCRAVARGSSFYADSYRFQGQAGDAIVIEMTSTSPGGLSYPYLNLLDGSNAVLRNEFGPTSARIPYSSGTYALPSTGTYTIEATSYSSNSTGGYTLTLTGPVTAAAGTPQPLTRADVFDPASGQWSSIGVLAAGRDSETATLLPSGRVLLTGGNGVSEALASAEMYEPSTASWTPTGSLNFARGGHRATLLTNGKVLIVGGYGSGGDASACELYDPATSTWSYTGSINPGRSSHTITLLTNGKVLVAGGEPATESTGTTGAQLYDPATGLWPATGAMNVGRLDHAATLLADGRVLVTGGNGGGSPMASSEIYSPSTGTWTTTASMNVARTGHTATLLPDGRVLVVGGWTRQDIYDYKCCAIASAEIFDPFYGTWTPTAPLQVAARWDHTALLLPNGKVMIVGGNPGGSFIALSSVEIYDPIAGTWGEGTPMAISRWMQTMTLLPDGTVLVAGGGTGSATSARSSAYVYVPALNVWKTVPDMSAEYDHTATLMLDGRVLVAGGSYYASGGAVAQIFDTGLNPTSRRPVITSAPSALPGGLPFSVTGTGFRADSETSGGTTSSSAAVVPQVQLLSLESDRMTWLTPDSRPNFWDDPMTLAFANAPLGLDLGWHLLTVVRAGVASVSRLVEVQSCEVSITTQPQSAVVAVGTTHTFSVVARGARTYQWQRNGVDLAGATGRTYTTLPVLPAESGSIYTVRVNGACSSTTSDPAVLTIADSIPPTVAVVSPSGGEYWLLSTSGNPPNTRVVTWSMADNVRVCQVSASLLFSDDGGVTYTPAPGGGGLPATFGPGGTCAYPGEGTTSLMYTVPIAFPSGRSGSLYKVRVVVTDHAGNVTDVTSASPFYIVQANPDSVKTLILANVTRMMTRQGISSGQATQISGKLQELANHPRVQGLVVDLNSVTSITTLYAAWNADGANATKANAVLFGPNGIQDYVRTNLLTAYSGVKYLVLVGDDRIIPMARMQDHTALLPESSYPAAGDLSPTLTTVGQALAAGKYLTDDPLAVMDTISAGQLDGNLFLPDLSVGRLVETPQQIIGTIATYISQDGILDLSLLNATTGHKVLVTGYDFLSNVSTQMRARWKSTLGVSTADSSQAPVDGSLIGGNWGLGSVAARSTALRTRISGNGGPRYGVMAIAGHATHYEEGVPGTNPLDIQGLSTADLYGADSCATPSLGGLDLSGGVVYAVGCHGGLSVPGSCRTDANHSLDLPETMLGRGAVAYIANSGYGWGLKFGIGYGARLTQIFTEQMTSGGTIAVGDAVRQSKQRYYLETPRYDPYDEKSVMQWTLYGLPMYAVKTGITTGALSKATVQSTGSATEERLGAVRVGRQIAGDKVGPIQAGGRRLIAATTALPPSLTQLNLSFDFTASGVFQKHDSAGTLLSAGPGCPDANGCYYTLNGLVDRGTGSGDLPIQPYLIYDSRLSGTSQHGVLWRGGTYDEESGWTPVIAELVSNGGDGSNHGSAPRVASIRPTAPRVVPGLDSPTCRPSDLEVNSLTVAAGEAVKNETTDLSYSIARRYRNIDLEVYYFNNQSTPTQNCDRSGPALGTGPYAGEYHQKSGSTLTWAVPASDASGVWRVVVVYNPNTVDGQGRGTWTPLDLTNDGGGTFRGSISVSGVARLTYVIQAVDNRGNITWLDYVSAQLPSSGVALGLPNPVDVMADASAPTGVIATATSATSVAVSWNWFAGAASYDVYRSASGTNYSKIGSSGTASYTDNNAAANTAYLYAVKAIDGGGNPTPFSSPDLATTVMFTDSTLMVGSTLIKAVHITELRTAVDAVRTLAGIGGYSFTDSTLRAGLTMAYAVHITDLRTGLNAARTTLNLTPLVYTDTELTPNSTLIKAAHIDDLRNGVR
jgi:N-acetylneuraminic acid mutarotase